MNVIKFQNKIERKKLIWLSVATPILAMIIIFNISVSSSFLYLIAALVSFISILSYAKKFSSTLEEIIIKEGSIKFYVFDKRKNPIEIQKDQVMAKVESESISFSDKTGKLIGVAFKKMVEEPQSWNSLVDEISSCKNEAVQNL